MHLLLSHAFKRSTYIVGIVEQGKCKLKASDGSVMRLQEMPTIISSHSLEYTIERSLKGLLL